jgi:transcriptional regulator with XRE-family HTH domain
MEREKPRARGRPRSDTKGAQDAFDIIRRYLELENLSLNELALRCELTPSSVARALANREETRWTPTFKTIYSVAKNNDVRVRISPAMKRLAAYQGPGEVEVKRLLDDVEALITTLSASKG